MDHEQLEFLISQYADDTLDAAQVAAVKERLRTDGAARAMLEDHHRVSSMLTANTALPAIKWDRLGDAISKSLDRAEAERIERRFSMPFARVAAGFAAVAACLLIGFAVFRGREIAPPVAPVAAARVIEISLPSPEVAQAPRIAEVVIEAPLDRPVFASVDWSDLQPRSTRILIATGEPPAVPDALTGY